MHCPVRAEVESAHVTHLEHEGRPPYVNECTCVCQAELVPVFGSEPLATTSTHALSDKHDTPAEAKHTWHDARAPR